MADITVVVPNPLRTLFANAPATSRVTVPDTEKPFVGDDSHVVPLRAAILHGQIVQADRKIVEQAGLKTVPVAISKACYFRHVAWCGDSSQDVTGRLWDVLMLVRAAILNGLDDLNRAVFAIESVPQGKSSPITGLLKVAYVSDENDEPLLLVTNANESVSGLFPALSNCVL